MIISKLFRRLLSKSHYLVYKKKDLPPGVNLFFDLRYKFPDIKIENAFDVGANIGQSTLALKCNFPDLEIFAFEPVKSTFGKLKENTQQLKNIHLFNFALGENEDQLTISLFDNEESVRNSLHPHIMNNSKEANSEVISIKKLDSFVQDQKIEKIDFLKIDTEGWEKSVLRGAENFLKAKNITFIYCEVALNPFDLIHTQLADLNSYLSELGYYFFSLYETSHSGFNKKGSYSNALFVKEGTVINKYSVIAE